MHRARRCSARPATASKGFTLVELLVVVAIIAILLSILLPTIAKARDAAVRIRCAATLRTWGHAINNYYADNRGQLPISYGAGEQPSAMWMLDVSGEWAGYPEASPREASIEKFAKYLHGFNYDPSLPRSKQQLSGAWLCPAASNDQRPTNAGWFPLNLNYATHMHYAYFARVSDWNFASNPANPYLPGGRYFDPDGIFGGTVDCTNPEDFVDNKLDSKKLLMSDMILYRPGAGGWLYNHARIGVGLTVWAAEYRNAHFGSIHRIGGVNQLFGDGHVEWKSRDDLRVDLLIANPTQQRHVNETYY